MSKVTKQPLKKDGWQTIKVSWELPICEACQEEPWCPDCQMHFGECGCLGSMEDEREVEYVEFKGVMYGRRRTN